MPNRWADYPFPLISTPAGSGADYHNQFVKSASKMALMHNVIIRGMNCMYLQAEYITPGTAPDFLTFCRAWCETINNHHYCEEEAYFPIIEKACGIEGISDSNVEQHDAFTPGLEAFEAYVHDARPTTLDACKIVELLDNFAAILQIHLTDEVVWILSLSQYENLDLAAIDVQHGNFVRAHSSKITLLPYLLTNHDLTYEGGIHQWWPSDSKLRVWYLRYICTLWNSGAWKYSSCGKSGNPRKLYAIQWSKSNVESSMAMMGLMPQMAEMGPPIPAMPQKAYTERPRSNESEEYAGAKHSRGRATVSTSSVGSSVTGDRSSSTGRSSGSTGATTPVNSVTHIGSFDDEKRPAIDYSATPLPPLPTVHNR